MIRFGDTSRSSKRDFGNITVDEEKICMWICEVRIQYQIGPLGGEGGSGSYFEIEGVESVRCVYPDSCEEGQETETEHKHSETVQRGVWWGQYKVKVIKCCSECELSSGEQETQTRRFGEKQRDNPTPVSDHRLLEYLANSTPTPPPVDADQVGDLLLEMCQDLYGIQDPEQGCEFIDLICAQEDKLGTGD